MTFDYLILGGGITGVAAARLLQLSGVENFHILEAEPEPGGLCRTRQIGPHVLDIGGGHFLCTRHAEVYDFIFAHLPKSEFNYFQRVSKVAIDGHEIDYPIETNIWQLPAALCAEYLVSIAQNGEARGLPPPTNFEEWIRWKLGDLVAERYMLPYNKKIWGVAPQEMDVDWLHKIPRVDVLEIARSCLTRNADRSLMPSHAGFYYPKAGGFQRIFDALLAPVRDRLETGVRAESIAVAGDELVVNGRFRARQVINTIPWHYLRESPVFDADTRSAIDRLRHNQIVVSLHEADFSTDAHWLYQPDERTAEHRSFFIPNFAPHSASNGFYRETNVRRWQSGEERFAHVADHAYPIPTLGWAAAIDRVLDRCRRHRIHGLGRWGQWQYFNSDVCIHEAMKLVGQLGHTGWKNALAAPLA